jgi:hypothetical protein
MSDALPVHGGDWEGWGAVIVKARTLLLMCGLSLAGAPAAERIAPLHGPDGWPVSPPDKGHDLRRRVPHTAQDARVIPLPRPRPYVLEKTGAIRDYALNAVTAGPPAAPMAQAAPLAAPGPQNASTPQPGSTLFSPTEQGAAGQTHRQTYAAETPKWAAVEPVKDNGGAAMPLVSVRDAGDGRIQIEAHDASVGQVLAALQESGLIRFSASDQLSRTVSGSYTGTLPQVLSRILDGYNYFLHVTPSGTELHALNPSSDANAALRSGSSDDNAALRSGVGSNVEAATAPAPAFSLSRPNPISQARARARAQQAARRH